MIKKDYWWSDYPWRIVQTNMREIDMADMDAKRYVSELQKFSANFVIINTGGIVANYDTEFPFHHKNSFLAGDKLTTVVNACKEAGIRVASRVDFSKVRKHIYEQHPDWAFVDVDGKIIDYHGNVHVCFNSAYQQQHAISVMREIIEKINPDSIFMNMGGYMAAYDYDNNWHGICQCDNCRRLFREWSGWDLPKREGHDDEVYRLYLKFQAFTIKEHRKNIKEMIQAEKPELLYFETDMLRGEAGTFLLEDRMNYLFKASDLLKLEKCSYPEKAASVTSVDFIDMNWRFAGVSPHQQELRIAQTLANGGFADFYQVGRLDNHPDKSSYEALRRMFKYHKDHEEDYHGHDSLSKMLLLKPNSRGRSDYLNSSMEYSGWFNLLTEQHYLFDCMEASKTTADSLKKYEVIILPNARQLNAESCKCLDSFAESGGTLIAVGQTAQFDEEGAKVVASPLQSLGVERICYVDKDPVSAYFLLEDKSRYPRFKDSDYCYLRGPYSYQEYSGTVEKHMKLIPPHRHSPAESAYHTNITDYPSVAINAYGDGRGVCIPWLPGTEYLKNGFPHMCNFMADTLEHLLGIKPCGGNLPPMVEVEYAKRPDDSVRYVHLVNCTGHFLKAYFKPITLGDLFVSVDAPERTPESVIDMATGKPCKWSIDGGKLNIEVERLELFSAIRIKSISIK
jgi:hypothetical protein